MEFNNIEVEYDGAVATITLARPESLNALDFATLDELFACLESLNKGDDIRVIRIRGSGRAFCVGYDLVPGKQTYAVARQDGERSGGRAADLGESDIALDRERLRRMIQQWQWMWGYRKPIIAQVHGYCLSGALDLIGACDLVMSSSSCKFGHPAARGLGIPMTLGMLPAKIGAAATKEILFTGDFFSADWGLQRGMVNRVFSDDDLDAETMKYAQRVSLMPMDALTVHKHVTNRWLELAGVRVAALEGAEFDSIFHMTASLGEFSRIAEEFGLREALDWRDGPYRG